MHRGPTSHTSGSWIMEQQPLITVQLWNKGRATSIERNIHIVIANRLDNNIVVNPNLVTCLAYAPKDNAEGSTFNIYVGLMCSCVCVRVRVRVCACVRAYIHR